MLTRAKYMGEGSVGEVLRTIRKNKGIKLKELAQMTGLTESAISKYENDKRKPSMENYFKLLEALGADIYIMHD